MSVSQLFLVGIFLISTNLVPIMSFEQPLVNGTYDCKPEEYSHFVSILVNKEEPIKCGGTLIRNNWVLTSAKCCNGFSPKDFLVAAGMNETSNIIENVFLHDAYTEKPLDYDLCLLKLSTSMNLTEQIKLTNLATSEEYQDLMQNRKCVESATMEYGNPSNKDLKDQPLQLQCSKVQIASHDNCQGIQPIGENSFCAINPTLTTSSSCSGNFGGPIFCNDLQIGIHIENSDSYEIYSRVDVHADFIKRTIQENFEKERRDLTIKRIHFDALKGLFWDTLNFYSSLLINLIKKIKESGSGIRDFLMKYAELLFNEFD